jgi:ankyrin
MKFGWCLLVLLSAGEVRAANSDVADAAMKGNREAVRSLLLRKADANAPQIDGTTAIHWAVRVDDLDLADMLIRAGANVSVANREGVTPMQLAAMNGNAAMLVRLVKAGADPNAPLTEYGDTALMMASRTGKTDAITVLLEGGGKVNAVETWGGTTALMWAVSERHPAAVKVLVDHGADVNVRSNFVPAANGRGFEGRTPAAPKSGRGVEEFASGSLTPLMFAAREGDVESARLLVSAGADVNAIAGDGKDALGLAIFNGNYDLASFLVDNRSKVNQADTQGFTPLFWAVDRRNMETAPNFPWMVTTDPLPLIKKLLDAGASPNVLVNNTPRARMRAGSPRIVFATALMRAAFSGDLDLTKLLLSYKADPGIVSKDSETMVEAAAGLGFIQGYSRWSAAPT